MESPVARSRAISEPPGDVLNAIPVDSLRRSDGDPSDSTMAAVRVGRRSAITRARSE